MENIHLKIRAMRLLKNYTQEYIAEHLGVSLRTYQNIESGKSPVTLDRIEKIVGILGITMPLIENPEISIATLEQKMEHEELQLHLKTLQKRIDALEAAFLKHALFPRH